MPRPEGCAFCTRPSHVVRSCHSAKDYVNSGRATLRNHRICLPTGEPIPNDGSGRGLKHAIDKWLAKHGQSPGGNESTAATVASASTRDPPPHRSLSFEVVQSEVHMVEIADASDSDGSDCGELYDLNEVLATEMRRREVEESSPVANATGLPCLRPQSQPVTPSTAIRAAPKMKSS